MTAKNVQARRAKRVQGKPAWYGQYRLNSGGWRSLSTGYGRIVYASPEAARTAASDVVAAAS